jgi:PAS domain S-box-containing protein
MSDFNAIPKQVTAFLQDKNYFWYYTRSNSTIYFNQDLQNLMGYRGVIISDDDRCEDGFPNKASVVFEDDLKLLSRELTRLQSHFSFFEIRVKDSKENWLSFSTKLELLDTSEENAMFCGRAIHKMNVDFTTQSQMNSDFFYKLYLESLISSLPVAVFTKESKEHRYITWNKAMTELTGIPAGDVIGKTDFDLYPEEEAQRYVKDDLTIVNEKKPITIDDVFWSKHGVKKMVKIIKVPNMSRNGDVEFIIGICVDLSEEKVNEIKLKQSESRYKALLEALNMRIVLTDMAHNIILSNSPYFTSLGYSKEQFHRLSEADLVHPDDLSYYLNIKESLTKEDTIDFEYRVRHQKGYWLNMLAKSIIIKNEEGVPTNVLLIINDITEQKFREKILRENQLFLQTLIDNLPVAIYVKNVEKSKYEIWNSEAERVTGIAKEDAIGKTNAQIFPAPIAEIFDNTDEQVIASGKIVRIPEEQLPYQPVKLKYFNTTKIPVNEQGIPRYILVMSQEITKQKKTELELVNALERAKESDRLKTAFINNISHEIRTPLNAIIGSANLLNQSELSNEEKLEYNNILNRSSEKLLHMISDIMDISRIETKQYEIIFTDTKINMLIAGLAKKVNVELVDYDKVHLKVNPRFYPDDEFKLNVDPNRFSQIFLYLLSNSLKFTLNGEIEFGFYDETETEITFFVKDSGIGIPSSMHKAIFEKFFQLEMSLTKEYSGLGIGLYLTKAIIMLMGGRIWLESEPERGSVFYFSFLKKPLQHMDKQNRKIGKQNGKDYNWEGKIILVVDDTRSTTTLLKKLLERNDATVLTANSGMQALEILDLKPNLDLVLLDLQMPVMSGSETAEKMHEKNPKLKIVAQSAYTLEEDREFVENVNFAAYLTKPIITPELYKVVDIYLKN